jgi:hypothetical protein
MELARFYTVTDRRHFVGTFGLLNSRAFVGSAAPLGAAAADLEPARSCGRRAAGSRSAVVLLTATLLPLLLVLTDGHGR